MRNLNRRARHPGRELQAAKGEILGFAGLMGAGRTEVARAIFGADTLDGGEIIVKAEPVSIRTPRDAVRLRHRLSLGGPQALRAGDRHGRGRPTS